MLRVVVLPEPVPPEMIMFNWPERRLKKLEHLRRDRARSTSFWGVMGMRANLRIVSTGPMSDKGGIMALTREPSAGGRPRKAGSRRRGDPVVRRCGR